MEVAGVFKRWSELVNDHSYTEQYEEQTVEAALKVIEAAKAYYQKEKHRRMLLPHDELLFDALDALLELEKGEER